MLYYVNRVYQSSTMEQSKHLVVLMTPIIGSHSGHSIILTGEREKDIRGYQYFFIKTPLGFMLGHH